MCNFLRETKYFMAIDKSLGIKGCQKGANFFCSLNYH